VDIISTTTQFQHAREALMPQLNSLLGSFGITLPALNSQGNVTQSAMNSLYAAAAAAFPAVWVPANATLINGLLTSMGLLATVLMPLAMVGITLPSGTTNQVVTVAVVLPATLPSAAFGVFVDTGGQALTWVVTGKTTTGFNVAFTPATGAAVAAGTFSCLVCS
jgi:hypothetical protein